MGVNLVRRGNGVSLSNFGWLFALSLAERYDWSPIGAKVQRCNCDPPAEGPMFCLRCDEWERVAYALSDWQCVEDEDASAFGSALNKALEEPAALERALEAAGAGGDESGWRQRLTELAVLAKGGAFLIA